MLAPERPPDGKPAPTVVAGQADAQPGTLVARSTFPMLYPVLAPERPPDGKPAPTVVAGQADAQPGTLVARSTFPMLYPVLAPERPPDGKPAPTFLAATLSVVLLQPVAVGLLNLLRPPSKVRAQAPSVTPEPALVNHARVSDRLHHDRLRKTWTFLNHLHRPLIGWSIPSGPMLGDFLCGEAEGLGPNGGRLGLTGGLLESIREALRRVGATHQFPGKSGGLHPPYKCQIS